MMEVDRDRLIVDKVESIINTNEEIPSGPIALEYFSDLMVKAIWSIENCRTAPMSSCYLVCVAKL